jgi:hypothetical protein
LADSGANAGEKLKNAADSAGNAFDRAIRQASATMVEQLTRVLTKLENAIKDLAARL